MELDLIFQLVASTTATLCSVASLAFWLLYTEALSRGKRNKQQLIYSQIMIGGIIILGSVASMLLALKRTTTDNGKQLCLLDDKSFLTPMLDLSRSISAVEIGVVLLLLILNEVRAGDKCEVDADTHLQYLCISTLQSFLTHMTAGLFFVVTIVVLSLTIYQPASLNWLLHGRSLTNDLSATLQVFACVVHVHDFGQPRVY